MTNDLVLEYCTAHDTSISKIVERRAVGRRFASGVVRLRTPATRVPRRHRVSAATKAKAVKRRKMVKKNVMKKHTLRGGRVAMPFCTAKRIKQQVNDEEPTLAVRNIKTTLRDLRALGFKHRVRTVCAANLLVDARRMMFSDENFATANDTTYRAYFPTPAAAHQGGLRFQRNSNRFGCARSAQPLRADSRTRAGLRIRAAEDVSSSACTRTT